MLYFSDQLYQILCQYTKWFEFIQIVIKEKLFKHLKNHLYFFSRDNGTCTQCVAFLFSLTSFWERHRDRGTIVGTDTQCVWNKPRIRNDPQEIIETRVDPTQNRPLTYCCYMYNGFLQPNFTGSGTPTLPWEGVIWTCWGTDVLVLQTFESDDGTVIMIMWYCQLWQMLAKLDSLLLIFCQLLKTWRKFLINEKNCEIEDQPKWKHITGNHLVYIKVGFMHLLVFDGNMKIAPPRQSFSRS